MEWWLVFTLAIMALGGSTHGPSGVMGGMGVGLVLLPFWLAATLAF